MRLTCPNCDAQYEVDDKAVPDGGRDVQCSNCGHAWFQLPPDVEEALRDEATTFGDSAEAEAPPAAREPAPEPESEPDAEADDAGEVAPAAPPQRRELDESLRHLLREEAAREEAARRGEGNAIETQADLGLDVPISAMGGGDATLRRIERLRRDEPPIEEDENENEVPGSEPDDEDEAGEPVANTRRALLPDIEEINSTLRASSEHPRNEPGAEVETPTERRRGFRMGFSVVLMIVTLLLVAYVSAPNIVARVPATAGIMRGYVATVDSARAGLDRLMTSATRKLRGTDATTGN